MSDAKGRFPSRAREPHAVRNLWEPDRAAFGLPERNGPLTRASAPSAKGERSRYRHFLLCAVVGSNYRRSR